MILGKIVGKISTNEFNFLVEKQTKKFEYLQVYHPVYEYVLCQVVEIETDHEKTIAKCQIIGYKEGGRIKKLKIPFEPSSEVLKAEDELIKDIVEIETKNGAYIGDLDGKDIPIRVDLEKVLSTHLSVLAKSGSGKSYAVGVLLEEMLEKNIPILVIDPHGEYNSLKHKNENVKEVELLSKHSLSPKQYEVEEFGDPKVNPGVKPLKLSLNMTQEEISNLLPGKLSNSQLAVLYSSFKAMDPTDLDSLIVSIDQEESSAKYSLMSMVQSLRDIDIFSTQQINYSDFVKSGRCTILNLRGVNPDVQEIVVYKISKELFELRKKGAVPPFFLVVEEAHNYCPERSFGETKSSKVLRNIASEGRKFGLGLCIISQRPARVDKSVLSQCSTQLILKVTNPNDLKAVSSSIEGITSSTENEIQNLVIGQALVTGITQMPLLVNIRPRRSMHGGTSQSALDYDLEVDYAKEEQLPIIKTTLTKRDAKLMKEENQEVNTKLIPCALVESQEGFSLLVNLAEGSIIVNKEPMSVKYIPDMRGLNQKQISILKYVFKHGQISMDKAQKEDLQRLETRGFLKARGLNYVLSDKYVFSKLHNYKTNEKIVYETVKYDEKVPAPNKEQFLNKLKDYVKVKQVKECYIQIHN